MFSDVLTRILRIKKSYLISVGVLVAMGLWLISGQLMGPTPNEAQAVQPGPDAVHRLAKARVAHLVAAPIMGKIVVQGETRPNRAVEVKAEVRGPVIEAAKPRGARVVKGEELFRIADLGVSEQLEKAEAMLALRQAEYEAAKSLAQEGFNTQIKLSETRSNLASARAELRLRQIDVDNLIIRAPFDGVLDERLVEEGDFVEAGRAVAKVVELDPIKIVGQVAESDISDITLGMAGEIELADGRRFPARLTFLSSVSDPQTRTFEIELTAPNPDGAVAGGLTATIHLPTHEREGHLVSPSVLTLSDEGQIGVKIVDRDDRARFVPVTILEESPQGTWLGGLPEEIDLIVVGQDFIAEGEQVEKVYVTPPGASLPR